MSVRKAIGEVSSVFPFSGYIEDTHEEILHVAELLLKLSPQKGRLLDIGSGPMNYTAVFQKIGFNCFACDDFADDWHRRDNNFEKILEFARNSKINLHVQNPKDFKVPWDTGTFDVCTILNVIEHLHQSPRDLLNFAGKFLKPDGLLFITMPNSVNLRKRLSVAVGRTNYAPISMFYESTNVWRGHVREYTLAETVQIVNWSGFDVISAGTYHGMTERKIPSAIARSFYKGICAAFPGFRDSIYVAAVKPHSWIPKSSDSQSYRKASASARPHGIK